MEGAFATEPTVESVWVISLNTNFRPLGRIKISSGTLNSCLIHPREIFRAAIMTAASKIVLVHNHPSGVMPHPVLCRTVPVSRSEDGRRHAA
jgi:DNA repair protein RadC